jgi:hypothetical protein
VAKGGEPDARYPMSTYFRDYWLVKHFGWTKAEIDEQPAVWLDWMLAIHSEISAIENSTA